jgi:hypothetical protein
VTIVFRAQEVGAVSSSRQLKGEKIKMHCKESAREEERNPKKRKEQGGGRQPGNGTMRGRSIPDSDENRSHNARRGGRSNSGVPSADLVLGL